MVQSKLVGRSYFSASKQTCRRSNAQVKLVDQSLIKEARFSIEGCESKLASKEISCPNEVRNPNFYSKKATKPKRNMHAGSLNVQSKDAKRRPFALESKEAT